MSSLRSPQTMNEAVVACEFQQQQLYGCELLQFPSTSLSISVCVLSIIRQCPNSQIIVVMGILGHL